MEKEPKPKKEPKQPSVEDRYTDALGDHDYSISQSTNPNPKAPVEIPIEPKERWNED